MLANENDSKESGITANKQNDSQVFTSVPSLIKNPFAGENTFLHLFILSFHILNLRENSRGVILRMTDPDPLGGCQFQNSDFNSDS